MNNKIRHYRDRYELSLRDVEALTGISNPYIFKLEKGLQTPSLPIARKLAKAFDTTLDELFPEPNTETNTTLSA